MTILLADAALDAVPEWAWHIAAVGLAGIGAGFARVLWKSYEKRLEGVEVELKEHVKADTEHHQTVLLSLARVEGKLDGNSR